MGKKLARQEDTKDGMEPVEQLAKIIGLITALPLQKWPTN